MIADRISRADRVVSLVGRLGGLPAAFRCWLSLFARARVRNGTHHCGNDDK